MSFACITVVKNAETAIAEWIAYQLAIGFDAVLLLDNNSTDRTVEIAQSFRRDHNVRIAPWPYSSRTYQTDGFSQALYECNGIFDWCACLDCDEFLVLPPGRTLRDLTSLPQDVSAIALSWAMFGSSGHIRRPNGLVIENYLQRSHPTFGDNTLIKTLCRPSHVQMCRSPHFIDVTGRYVDMNHRGIESIDYRLEHAPDYTGGKLHHYYVKSREDWDAKIERGYNDIERRPQDFERCDRNEVFDDSAASWAPDVRKILSGLSAA